MPLFPSNLKNWSSIATLIMDLSSSGQSTESESKATSHTRFPIHSLANCFACCGVMSRI